MIWRSAISPDVIGAARQVLLHRLLGIAIGVLVWVPVNMLRRGSKVRNDYVGADPCVCLRPPVCKGTGWSQGDHTGSPLPDDMPTHEGEAQ